MIRAIKKKNKKRVRMTQSKLATLKKGRVILQMVSSTPSQIKTNKTEMNERTTWAKVANKPWKIEKRLCKKTQRHSVTTLLKASDIMTMDEEEEAEETEVEEVVAEVEITIIKGEAAMIIVEEEVIRTTITTGVEVGILVMVSTTPKEADSTTAMASKGAVTTSARVEEDMGADKSREREKLSPRRTSVGHKKDSDRNSLELIVYLHTLLASRADVLFCK